MFGRSLLVFLSILYLVPTLCEFGHLWLILLASTGRMPLMDAHGISWALYACGPVGVTVRLQGYSFDAKGRAVDMPRLYAAYMLSHVVSHQKWPPPSSWTGCFSW